jgi:lipoate synthase
MMKATISFDLSDEDDRRHHEACVNAMKMAASLYNIRETLCRHLNGKRELENKDLEEICEEIYCLNISEIYT